MQSTTCDAVSNIISLLGGPVISSSELQWATELESGKRLLEFIASQIDLPLHEDVTTREDRDLMKGAAMNRIAIVGREPGAEDVTPRIARYSFLDTHAFLVEDEVRLLKERLKQTKLISQRLVLSAQRLASEIRSLDSEIDAKQNLLSELSIHTDTSVANLCHYASETLEHVLKGNEQANIETVLRDSANLRTEVLRHMQNQTQEIQDIIGRIPSKTEVQAEASRLDTDLDMKNDKGNNRYVLGQEFVYCQELDRLASMIEQTSGEDGEIYDILQDVASESQPTVEPGISVDVQGELESAWNSDQATYLTTYIGVLDQAVDVMEKTVLPPLKNVYATLSANQTDVEAVVDLVGAIGQELGGINAELKSPNKEDKIISQTSNSYDEYQAVKSLLKSLRESKTSDDPLILLDEQDVLNEITHVCARKQDLDLQEIELEKSISTTLNKLLAVYSGALSRTYANSPLNSSPPYAPAPSTVALLNKVEAESTQLVETVQKLQQEIESMRSSRTQRKLQFFVDRWNTME